MITVEKLLSKLNPQDTTFIVELSGEQYTCDRMPFSQLLKYDDNHDVETQVGSFNRNMEVIYMSCPIFRQLANQTEIIGDPYKIVEKVLNPAEIYAFHSKILSQYVNQKVTDAEAVKKQ